jgi:hypothetical protein
VIRPALALLLLPLAAQAQLALSTVDSNGVTTPLGSSLDMGSAAVGDTKDVRIRLRNTGPAPLTISRYFVDGQEFTVNRPSLPFIIAPGNLQDTLVRFTPDAPGAYAAALDINGATIAVTARAVAAATLSVSADCTLTSSTLIDFGSVQTGQSRTCDFSLENPTGDTITISTLSVSGPSFAISAGPSPPIGLAPGSTVAFSISFTAAMAAFYSGTLTVESRSYSLKAAAYDPALPAPILEFDAGPPASAQQRKLTMRMASPSPLNASGFVNLAFQPDTSVVADDPAVVFLATGTRTLPFSVNQGDTQIRIAGQSAVFFQTGTTAGQIRFTLSGVSQGIAGDPALVMTIPAATITLDLATVTRRPAALDVALTGFDNTYTTGVMNFTFLDTSGNVLGPIRADFTSNFASYFIKTKAGSAFQALVTFPVSGDASQIASVDVSLVNAAGAAQTQRLVFP